jgi:hypothetical protein
MKRLVHLAVIILLGGILTACYSPAQSSPAPTPSHPKPSPTPLPTPTPFTVKGVIHPGDTIGDMTITNEESKHFFWFYDLCNFNWSFVEPFSQTVECTVPELAAVGIGAFWGAQTVKFSASWEPITWELYVDDFQVALDEFGYTDVSYYDPSAGFDVTFRGWNVLLRDLAAGRHNLRFSWATTHPVDDGWNTYPPGKYEYIADLTVTEKPVYPLLPPIADSGQHAYASSGGDMDFLLYVPESYGTDPARKWPLIVYLHDAELRGTNPDFLRRDSLPKRLETLKDFPFLVISPSGNGDWDFWSTDAMIDPVLGILEEVQSVYPVDANRIYLTGAGMGGNGVWAMGLRNPEYFTALAPLGGYIYPFEIPKKICNLIGVPIWAFHGEEDFMIPPQREKDLVEAVNACGGAAQFTLKPGTVIPLEVYYGSQLFDWFLSHSKK